MSVPTLLPSGATVELSGPPNWLNPKVPRVPVAAPEPGAGPAAGGARGIFNLGLLRGAVSGAVPGRQDQGIACGAEGSEPGRAHGAAVNDVPLAAKEVLFRGDPRSLFQRHVGVAGHEICRGHLGLRAWRCRRLRVRVGAGDGARWRERIERCWCRRCG